MEIIFRKGQSGDIPKVFDLIKELALFEKAPEQVIVTPEQMLEDGFGNNPAYGLYVAESEGVVIGMAVYYYRYSTWKGKTVYLEDLLVTENFRKQEVGSGLLNMVLEHAKSLNCQRVSWQVLDWNESAINFYKKFNATFDSEWLNCFIELR